VSAACVASYDPPAEEGAVVMSSATVLTIDVHCTQTRVAAVRRVVEVFLKAQSLHDELEVVEVARDGRAVVHAASPWALAIADAVPWYEKGTAELQRRVGDADPSAVVDFRARFVDSERPLKEPIPRGAATVDVFYCFRQALQPAETPRPFARNRVVDLLDHMQHAKDFIGLVDATGTTLQIAYDWDFVFWD
jgi:hypothetical protein